MTDHIFDVNEKAADPANCLQLRLKACFKGTKWQKVQSHDFRGSWATEAYSKGMDALNISQYLGHKDISTTTKYYLKIDPQMVLQKAAEKMNS